MNRIRIAHVMLLCLLLATVAYARPQQEEPKSHEAAAPNQQQPEAKPEGTDKQEPEKQENAKPEKTEKNKQAEDKKSDQEKQEKPASRSNMEGATREQNGQSPAVRGGHIPDDKFRTSFGRQHHFSIGRPTLVNNQPGFRYGGYSFEIVDAWPADWAYADDCYVDYVDGEYFLLDLLHPGARVALLVVL